MAEKKKFDFEAWAQRGARRIGVSVESLKQAFKQL